MKRRLKRRGKMNIIIIVLISVFAYLIGSINFSIILSKAISGKDIRESGSGNAGATNMLRTHGKKMGIITLLLDVLKGVVVILLVALLAKALDANSESIKYIAGVSVVLGHNFPLYFGFRGGKGVATSLGVVLMLDWKAGLIIGICAIAVMAITRYVSLGSILGGIAFIAVKIIMMAISKEVNLTVLICTVILGGLLVVRHKENIKRLLNGTENKLGVKKGG